MSSVREIHGKAPVFLDHVGSQASGHIVCARRAGFLKNLDLHVMALV
jgi:hypothetical protein